VGLSDDALVAGVDALQALVAEGPTSATRPLRNWYGDVPS
jgi:hypothetical protein